GGNGDQTWVITGQDAGNVGRVSFQAIQNLVGGNGNDTFQFQDGAQLTGSIDGGGGINTLDYSAYTTSRLVTLTGLGSVSGFAGTEATSLASFTNINAIKGSQANDTLVGMDANASWVVDEAMGHSSYSSSSRLLPFTGFENLTGGNGKDTFYLDS